MLQQNMHQNYQAFTKTQQSFQVVLVVASLNQNTRTHKDESSRISDFLSFRAARESAAIRPFRSRAQRGVKSETESKALGLCEELSTVKTQCLKGRNLAATRGETHPGKQQPKRVPVQLLPEGGTHLSSTWSAVHPWPNLRPPALLEPPA